MAQPDKPLPPDRAFSMEAMIGLLYLDDRQPLPNWLTITMDDLLEEGLVKPATTGASLTEKARRRMAYIRELLERHLSTAGFQCRDVTMVWSPQEVVASLAWLGTIALDLRLEPPHVLKCRQIADDKQLQTATKGRTQ